MEATRFRLVLTQFGGKITENCPRGHKFQILGLHFVSFLYKSGFLGAKLSLCVNKFKMLIQLVLSVLSTMSIRTCNHN